MAQEIPDNRHCFAVIYAVVDEKAHNALSVTKPRLITWNIPQDLAPSCELEQITAVKIEKQKATGGIHGDVAQRVEEEIASIVRQQDRTLVPHQSEAGSAAAMRNIDPLAAIAGIVTGMTCNKAGVGSRNDRASGRVQPVESPARLPARNVARVRQAKLSGLYVLRAIAEALVDIHGEAHAIAIKRDLTVHPVSPARVKFNPEPPDQRPVA
jgi:hypothetical protein